MSDTSNDARLAVSFGASFLGFPTHLGFLRGLVAGGWRPAAVAGSSAGAIIAGLYAAGLTLDEIEAAVTRHDLKKHFWEPSFPLRALGTFMARPGVPAVLLGKQIERLFREVVGDLRIEDCKAASLHIAVTNFRTNAVEVRNSGPLVETIMASCALPGFLAPRRMDGELLWDGGLGSGVPIEQWIDVAEITHIAAHTLIHEELLRAREKPERLTFPGAMMTGHQLTADELLRWKLELARRMGKTVVAIETVTQRPRLGLPLTAPATKPWQEHSRDLMAIGQRSADKALDQLRASQPLTSVGEMPITNY
ncbi:MAG: patatin-like phospholipase family protein [Chthoniobacteraceae bacterium]